MKIILFERIEILPEPRPAIAGVVFVAVDAGAPVLAGVLDAVVDLFLANLA